MAIMQTNINQLNSDVQAMKSAIVNAGVEVEEGTPTSDFSEKISKVYEAGKQKAYDDFWDEFQENGNRIHYVNAFSFFCWTDKIYKPKYLITAKTYGLKNTFNYSQITNTLVPIEVYSQMDGSFTNSKIITIKKLILNNVTTITNPFGGCTNLKDIVVEGEWLKSISFAVCPLTTKSIVSVIEHLSDTTTEQTLTLKKSAVDAMTFPFTSEQSGITYNSWDELIATKSNWTITLM